MDEVRTVLVLENDKEKNQLLFPDPSFRGVISGTTPRYSHLDYLAQGHGRGGGCVRAGK